MLEKLLHNSLKAEFRSPFGAAAVGEPVQLSIIVPYGDVNVRLRLWANGQESILNGSRVGARFEFRFTPEHTGLIWYYFLLDTPSGIRYYGARSGTGAVFAHPSPAYQITVYEKGFETPAWFREGITYQVFIDRFNRANDGGGLVRTNYHKQLGREVVLHESWNESVMYAPLPGKHFYEPCDFYGGDIRGLIEKLDYISSLGVNCLYLNPIFESPSNHRYNTSDYMKIDPVLGDEKDLRELVAEAGKRDMHIMLDGVFSHTGADSVYFNKRGTYAAPGAYTSNDSPYYEWYDFRNYPDDYRCWWGFPTLPEVNELTPSYMEFTGQVIDKYASMGITSWRLDVADELPDEYIAFLRKRLKAHGEDAVLLGEVWDDASSKEGFGTRRQYVDGQELDSVMNYPFKNALLDFLLYRCDAHGLYARLLALRENYPKPFYEACLNLLGSHDTVRVLTVLSGAPASDALTREEQAHYKSDDAAHERGRKRLALAAMVQFAHPGVPCIYYGDEAGLTGMADPFCRAPYPWGHEDEHLRTVFRRLANLRSNSNALKHGACGFAAISDNVFAIHRTRENESVIVLVNRAESAESITLHDGLFNEGPDAKHMALRSTYLDVLTNATVHVTKGEMSLVLQPLSGAVLRAL